MLYLDVRTKKEYDAGHIEGAQNHDFMEMLDNRFPSFSKDTEVAVYSGSGERSLMAKTLMNEAGFTAVTDGGAYEELKAGL